MPIVVNHMPDPGILARSAYVAGAGEYVQREREMAQRERMQRYAIQANQYSQAAAQAGMDRRLMFDAAQDWNRSKMIAEARQQAEEIRARARVEEMQAKHENRMLQIMLENENAENVDVIKYLTGQAEAQLESIRDRMSDGYTFDQKGAAAWAAFQENQQALMTDPTLTGMARAQALYERAMQLPIPNQRAQSLQDQVGARTAKIQGADGRVMTVAEARDLTLLDDGKPDKQPEQKPQSPMDLLRVDHSFNKAMMDLAMDALAVEEQQGTDPATGQPIMGKREVKPEAAAAWVYDYVKSLQSKLDSSDDIKTFNPETGRLE